MPFFESTKEAGNNCIFMSVNGFSVHLPMSESPEIVSKELSATRCLNLDIESRLTIHFSSFNEIFTYSISGLIQRLVTPKIVSGRSVAVTNFASSNVNLIIVYSPISGSTSPKVSC